MMSGSSSLSNSGLVNTSRGISGSGSGGLGASMLGIRENRFDGRFLWQA